MHRLLAVTACLAATLGLFDSRLQAQKPGQLYLSLIGTDGKPVTDLMTGDVNVAEDGVACKILKLEPVDFKMKLQVLVDNGKANTSPINSLRDGLKAFFEGLPDGVEMSMLTTSPQPRTITKPTTDKQKLISDISLIAPDAGAGAFFDALFEASQRIDKDKSDSFPVIVMIGSDLGRNNVMDRDFQKMQETILKRAVTVHVIVNSGGGTTGSGGAVQTEVGLAVTKISGGRYDNINTTTRLATLLPEFAKRISDSQVKQTHQYRVTYERPANPKPNPQIGASVSRQGQATLSVDGHMP